MKWSMDGTQLAMATGNGTNAYANIIMKWILFLFQTNALTPQENRSRELWNPTEQCQDHSDIRNDARVWRKVWIQGQCRPVQLQVWTFGCCDVNAAIHSCGIALEHTAYPWIDGRCTGFVCPAGWEVSVNLQKPQTSNPLQLLFDRRQQQCDSDLQLRRQTVEFIQGS